MGEEITYLELSEGDSGSHKFYEVIIKDTEVSIRYGRIGDKGQQQTKTYPNAAKAQAEAQKKIAEKQRKGYAPAVMGARQKRQVTQRAVTSTASTSRHYAPTLWKFASSSAAFGIFISDDGCWLGNQKGQVYKLSPEGEVINHFQLPEGVKCIVADDIWIYVGCDDGNVYDLTGKLPHVAYTVDANIDIYWLDIYDGMLAISDANGAVVKLEPSQQSEWTRLSQGKSGWMVRADHQGIYHGHSSGVTMYDLADGRQIWHQPTEGSVLFGWQEGTSVYAGTSDKKLHRFSKTGTPEQIYRCDASVYSCATSPNGNYVFAGDNSSSLYCFNQQGERLWKLGTGCGSALSMQFLGEKLYIVTTDGSLACIDASESAITAAQAGNLPDTRQLKSLATSAAPAAVSTNNNLETTTDATNGVIVECLIEGNDLRMKVISEGYHTDWFVQFPRNIREAGARYWVEGVKESARGGFYRAYGQIKRLL
ncbi:MAG: WGR domain-containing protein [Pseudanabaena sp. ELA607]